MSDDGATGSRLSVDPATSDLEGRLRYRIDLERLIATISTRFIGLQPQEVDEWLYRALASIGELVGADRACLYRLEGDLAGEVGADPGPQRVRRTHEWHASGDWPLEGGSSADGLPWLFERLRRSEVVHVPRVGDLPAEAAADRAQLEAIGVRSLLALPMVSAGRLEGVVCFQSRRASRAWADDVIGLLGIVGDLFLNTLERRRVEEALRDSEERVRLVVSNAPVVLWAVDKDGLVTLSEGLGLAPLGLKPGEAVGQSVFEMYRDVPAIQRNIRRALAGEAFRAVLQVGDLWFESWHSPLRSADGQVTGAIGVATDVTERTRAEAALRESQERYELAMRAANDGLWDWDLRSDRVYYSPRWKAMLGLGDAEVGTSPREWLDRIHPDDVDRVREALDRQGGGATSEFEQEYRIRHADGEWRWVLSRGVALLDAAGKAYRLAGSQSDMTKRRLAEEKLLHDALHDALTGLPNRTLFVKRLHAAITRATDSLPFAVLFLDLDRFKLVNYGLGHRAGDKLLIEVGHRLGACLRPGDTVAHLGGDEFAVLLERLPEKPDVSNICQRFQEALREVHDLEGHEVFTSASIGVALGDPSYRSPEEVLRDADTAMFEAKGRGRGQHVVYDRRMQAKAIAQLRLDNDLKRAVERNQFRIEYQPIVSLADRQISGFEALVRWDHPERGRLSPEEFIAAAEETGLIIPIGRWMLGEACRQTYEWQQRFPRVPPLGVSVNLSIREFARPDLLEVVDDILGSTGLPPKTLKIEITETLIMDDAESALDTLLELKRLGVQLSIDDFGTGHSSLSRLHRFPIDTFKIDRSFVARIGNDDDNPEIVRTIVTLARNLGMDVVAEGVETRAQVDKLRALGCDYGQGYYFARPRLATEATELLRNGLGEEE